MKLLSNELVGFLDKSNDLIVVGPHLYNMLRFSNDLMETQEKPSPKAFFFGVALYFLPIKLKYTVSFKFQGESTKRLAN